MQAEVLRPELRDERLPAARVQEVFVRLDGGGCGEGQETNGLLYHAAVLQLGLPTEKLLGVLHCLQSLAGLDQLQVLLQSHLELQTGLQFSETTPVLVAPGQALGQVSTSQAVLHLSRRQENLNINKSELSTFLLKYRNCMNYELYISVIKGFRVQNCTTTTTI